MYVYIYFFSGSIKNSDTEKVGIRLTLFSLKLLAGFYNYYYADFLLLHYPLHFYIYLYLHIIYSHIYFCIMYVYIHMCNVCECLLNAHLPS